MTAYFVKNKLFLEPKTSINATGWFFAHCQVPVRSLWGDSSVFVRCLSDSCLTKGALCKRNTEELAEKRLSGTWQ